jgi:hypothetical protein
VRGKNWGVGEFKMAGKAIFIKVILTLKVVKSFHMARLQVFQLNQQRCVTIIL